MTRPRGCCWPANQGPSCVFYELQPHSKIIARTLALIRCVNAPFLLDCWLFQAPGRRVACVSCVRRAAWWSHVDVPAKLLTVLECCTAAGDFNVDRRAVPQPMKVLPISRSRWAARSNDEEVTRHMTSQMVAQDAARAIVRVPDCVF